MQVEIFTCNHADDGMAALSVTEHNGNVSCIATVKGEIVKHLYVGYTEKYAKSHFRGQCKDAYNGTNDNFM
jgi:hypothetical protein